MNGTHLIRPQPGGQMNFLSCPADGCVYGGAAYAGKSYAMLMQSMRGVPDPNYTGIIFRRKTTMLRTPGGLWETAPKIYKATHRRVINGNNATLVHNEPIGVEFKDQQLLAEFSNGAVIKFSHMEYEHNKQDHQGGSYAFIGFDEIQEFTKSMFMFLLTRNRPAAGCKIKPSWRATCNPDADSWLRQFIDWWIDPQTGLPIKDRAGVIRYYTIENDEFVWVDKDWYKIDKGITIRPRSFTFIPGTIEDNAIGRAADPSYESNLYSQTELNRQRLLYGNWNVSTKGRVFEQEWFDVVSCVPDGASYYRYWDFAATEQKENNDPDWTVGVLGALHSGQFYIVNVVRLRATAAKIQESTRETALADGYDIPVSWEEEKGSAGKFVSSHLQLDVLQGFEARPDPVSGDKISRAMPWAALAEHGYVHLVKGDWNQVFLTEAGSFPLNKRDQIDATSGCFKMLTRAKKVFPDYSRRHYVAIDPMWAKKNSGNAVVTVFLWGDKELGINGVATLWNREKKQMSVYGELYQPIMNMETLPTEIKKMAVIPMRGDNGMTVTSVFVNDILANGGDDIRRLLRKEGISAKLNPRANDFGGIAELTRLIMNGQFYVDTSCIRVNQELREFGYMDTGKLQGGYYMCKALGGVVTELKSAMEFQEKPAIRPYTKTKENMRKKLLNEGVESNDQWTEGMA